jgi:hypothetical protein
MKNKKKIRYVPMLFARGLPLCWNREFGDGVVYIDSECDQLPEGVTEKLNALGLKADVSITKAISAVESSDKSIIVFDSISSTLKEKE